MIGLRQNVRIIVYDAQGRIKDSVILQNEIKDAGLEMLAQALMSATALDCKIKYLAWGSDDSDNTPDQTKLVGEFGRKAVTEQESGGSGVVITTTYLAPYDATEETIKELGWFAGPSASATKDSGTMVARVLYERAKVGTESLQVIRTDTIAEVLS